MNLWIPFVPYSGLIVGPALSGKGSFGGSNRNCLMYVLFCRCDFLICDCLCSFLPAGPHAPVHELHEMVPHERHHSGAMWWRSGEETSSSLPGIDPTISYPSTQRTRHCMSQGPGMFFLFAKGYGCLKRRYILLMAGWISASHVECRYSI